jgi:hypothetical protein
MPLVNGSISYAPFPEGWKGDMDEAFQQSGQLATIYLEGAVLAGIYYPAGTTPPSLPTSDQGPIAMGGVWYFWDPSTSQYLPQSQSIKIARNFAKNSTYQIRQYSVATIPAGITKVCDMALARSALANVLATSQVSGPLAGPNNDLCQSALAYTVGPTLVPTPGATDLYAHEHLIEGSDIAMIAGEVLSLSFWVWVNQPGTFSVYLTSTGRDVSYVSNFTVSSANTWTRVVLNAIPALPTGMGTWNFGEGQTGLYIGVGLCVGTQWQATSGQLGTWQNAFLAGSAQNDNYCTGLNNQIQITGIKLEASPSATFLSVPSFEADFHDAIRYYWTSFSYQSLTTGVAVPFRGYGTDGWMVGDSFPRRMCKVPSVTPYGYTSKTAGNITNVYLGIDIAVASVGAVQKGLNDKQGVAAIATTGTTNSTTSITAIPSTAALAVGMLVGGSGIPGGAFISVINSSTAITISAAATTSVTGVALTFYPIAKGDALAAYVIADARLA